MELFLLFTHTPTGIRTDSANKDRSTDSKPCCPTFSLAMRKSWGFPSSKAFACSRFSKKKKKNKWKASCRTSSIQPRTRALWEYVFEVERPHDTHRRLLLRHRFGPQRKRTVEFLSHNDRMSLVGLGRRERRWTTGIRRHHAEAELVRLYTFRGKGCWIFYVQSCAHSLAVVCGWIVGTFVGDSVWPTTWRQVLVRRETIGEWTLELCQFAGQKRLQTHWCEQAAWRKFFLLRLWKLLLEVWYRKHKYI